MAQTVAVVRNTLTATGAGTTDFTKASFGTPAAAIIIVCAANSTNNPEVNAELSIGFWDGTNQRAHCIFATDNVGTSATYRGGSVSGGALISDSTATPVARYVVSNITDGIRLTMDADNTAVQRFCTVILFAGISAKVLTFTPNVTVDTATESASLGFTPKLVFFTCIGNTTSEQTGNTNAIFSFGFAANDTTHRAILFASDNGSAAEAVNLIQSETRCAGQVNAGALTWALEVTTFGSDTFTATTRTGGSGFDITFALALGGADLSFDVGTLTTPTGTGNSAVATDVAADAILLGLSTAQGTALETDADANGLMFGLADDNGQFSHNVSFEDAADTMNVNSAAQAAQILDLDTSSGGARAEMCDATVTLNNADFTLNYSATDATARKGFWIAFGPVASAASPATFIHHANFRFGQYGFVRPLRWWVSQSRAVWQRLRGRGSSG